MKRFVKGGGSAIAFCATLALLAAGCNDKAKDGETKAITKENAVAKNKGAASVPLATAPATADHSGYWCDEHGIPEAVCDLCSKKYREAEKAKGNWCEHSRVKSSCFKCNPGLKEKFAAEYKAKTGKDAPPVGDDETKDKN